jgi:transcription antitermination factor NusG
MPYHWYALSRKPNKEEIIGKQLQDRGYDVFYPYIPAGKDAGVSNTHKPLFPGYIFVRVDIEESGLSTFQWMKHSTGIVCMGGKPSHVPDRMIQAIQRRVVGNQIEDRQLSSGAGQSSSEKEDGIPTVIDGLFESGVSQSERSRVLLEMLSEVNLTS